MNRLYILLLISWFLMSSVTLVGQSVNKMPSDRALKQIINKQAPHEEAYMAVLNLAHPFIVAKDWNEAIIVLNTYKHLFPKMSHRFESTITMLVEIEEGWIVEVMGDNINSMNHDEFSPVPSLDGRFLYFASNRKSGSYGIEDVFVSELIDDVWMPAENIFGFVNTASSETPSSISNDGLQLVIFGNYDSSKGRGDLFVSNKEDKSWQPVIPFPMAVNTRYFEGDGVYSPDGRAFFFTSDRPGGIGGYHKRDEYYHGNYAGNLDIYVMEKSVYGVWSEPINLGLSVNTEYCDQDPFITPDGRTLYFSSDGHYGLGGMDIFKSTRLADTTWTRWGDPINLGKEINTVWDDLGYSWDFSGDSAFYSISVNGNSDIYTVKHPSVIPAKIDSIKIIGIVSGSNNSKVDAVITVTQADNDSLIVTTKADTLFGVFSLYLNDNNRYSVTAQREGFSQVSQTISLEDLEAGSARQLDFILQYIETGIPHIKVEHILFDYKKFDINPKQYPVLDELAEFIIKYPDARFIVTGHTDILGNDSENLKLSEYRVRSVAGYLKLRGVNSDLFEINYMASKYPVSNNDTEEGRRKNRRVEIHLIETDD
jgi:outer membrane protein OmpA-like peptidoglycan-associated protein